MSVLDPVALEKTKQWLDGAADPYVESPMAAAIAAMNPAPDAAERDAYDEYKSAARKLADATSAVKSAQLRFSAALQKLTAIVAPIEETK